MPPLVFASALILRVGIGRGADAEVRVARLPPAGLLLVRQQQGQDPEVLFAVYGSPNDDFQRGIFNRSFRRQKATDESGINQRILR